jgi:hypothetical protein
MATTPAPAGTIGHDQAAQILRLSPAELTKLAGSGVVPRISSGVYHPGTIIGAYIEHLRLLVAKLTEQLKRAQPETQDEIAYYLDISDRRLRELLAEWGISHKTTPIDDLRVRYIRKLREEAAGRQSATPGDLDPVQEGAALKKVQRERIELQNNLTRQEQAPIELLGEALAKAIQVMVSELDRVDALIAQTAPDLPEATRLAVLNCIATARNKAAARIGTLDIGTVDPVDDIDFEDDA